MRYLIAITVGPVQDFIAAARRTRDFWYGSFILSEISKSIARSMNALGCELIFPAPSDPTVDLAPGSGLNVANVILAITREGVPPHEVSESARQAAMGRWLEAAAEALEELDKLGGGSLIDQARFQRQIGDAIEFYSGWANFEPAPESYQLQRRDVMRLLAGAKSCRRFNAANETRIGIPKSSLDGSRETVFLERAGDATGDPPEVQRRLRRTSGEQLDALGLIKRLGDGKHFYPSVSRIAVDPWVRGAAGKFPDEWKEVLEQCDVLASGGLAAVRWPQFAEFPFEGQALYRSRMKALRDELQFDDTEYLSMAVEYVVKKAGDPGTYLAVLAADGDRMGAALSGMHDKEDHKLFSRSLASFAARARTEIELHHGCLVYAGGDDVLAFLPLDTALSCARQLHDLFSAAITEQCPRLLASPTLSIGLAIGHYLEPLEDLLSYGRLAEAAAKGGDRDGLAVHYHPRSGAPVRVRGRWPEGLDARLSKLGELHRDDLIGDKTAYDLRELSRLYRDWPSDEHTAMSLQADVHRLLSRKKGSSALRKDVDDMDHMLKTLQNAGDLHRLAEEMIVSREIGRAQKEASA